MYLKFIVTLLLVQAQAEQCTTPNNQPGACILLSSCTVLYEALQTKPEASVEKFVDKSICGGTKYIPMVCCGTSSDFTIPKTNISKRVTKDDLLPSRQYCGYQHSDDYFRMENDTSVRINEFPWLARLIHVTDSNRSEVFFDCAGSLISTRYVLTAAFCVDVELYPIIGVRLGEFAFKNETDCVQEPPYEEECTSFEDFDIEKIIRHPNYSNVNDINDIALLRLNSTVIYTDYIRPICLPSAETVRAKFGDILTTSGWEHTKSLVDHKKRILSKLVTKEECVRNLNKNSYPLVGKKLTENNMCTVHQVNQSQIGCNSDIGGPVMFSRNFQWQQEAIVYFSTSCLRPELADVHTSLTNYLEWIKESLEA